MTKLDLSMVLWQFKEGKKSHTDCLTAVDAYTDALIAAKPLVGGSLPSDKLIREKGKEIYHHGSYWSGVKADAFREGAKWMKRLWKQSVSRQ